MGIHSSEKRYHYSYEFGETLNMFFGTKGKYDDNCAGLCEDDDGQGQLFVKKAMHDMVNKIRARLKEIQNVDERLIVTTNACLSQLEGEFKEINDKTNNDLEIIALLFEMIALLLGYDYSDGKVYREVLYYQTREQEIQDFLHFNPDEFWKTTDTPDKEREKIILELKDKGMHQNVIARVMNTSEYCVRKILKKHGRMKPKESQ